MLAFGDRPGLQRAAALMFVGKTPKAICQPRLFSAFPGTKRAVTYGWGAWEDADACHTGAQDAKDGEGEKTDARSARRTCVGPWQQKSRTVPASTLLV